MQIVVHIHTANTQCSVSVNVFVYVRLFVYDYAGSCSDDGGGGSGVVSFNIYYDFFHRQAGFQSDSESKFQHTERVERKVPAMQ